MKWLIIAGFLVFSVRYGESGALKCDAEGPCTTNRQKEQSVEIENRRKEERQKEAECQAGSEWESNCHYCRCSEHGVAECLKQSTCDKEVIEEPIRCKLNTSFLRDCNTCVCVENGLGLCTLAQCRQSSIPKKEDLKAGKDCAPDTFWKSQCNDCGCSPDGSYYCTEKACLVQETEPMMKCAPDSVWKYECNTCWCTSDGKALCTRMGCENVALDITKPDEKDNPKLRIIKKECRPDEVFEIDCNTCRCNPDGLSFSCTRRACADQLDDEIKNTSLSRKTRGLPPPETPKACQPSQEFRIDCNTCLCDNEGQAFSCTRIDCTALNNNNNGGSRSKRDTVEKVSMSCSPGSVFDRDCNVCHCTEDGNHAVCTLKRCSVKPANEDNDVDEPVPESDPNFRCNPGDQFKRKCNDCTCSADGKSVFCTLRLCDLNIINADI